MRNDEESGSGNIIAQLFVKIIDCKDWNDLWKTVWLNYFFYIQQHLIFIQSSKKSIANKNCRWRKQSHFFNSHFSFLIICMICDILNIICAFKMWRILAVPFIVIEFVRLVFYVCILILTLLYIKKNINLGYLIVASVLGGFSMLILLYFWWDWIYNNSELLFNLMIIDLKVLHCRILQHCRSRQNWAVQEKFVASESEWFENKTQARPVKVSVENLAQFSIARECGWFRWCEHDKHVH